MRREAATRRSPAAAGSARPCAAGSRRSAGWRSASPGRRRPRAVRRTVKRMACSTRPRSHSSKRMTAGKIGRPAASDEVQPSGRSLFDLQVERRLAGRLPAVVGLAPLVELVQHAVDRIDDEDVPVALAPSRVWASASLRPSSGQFSIGALSGIGYGPGSDSSGYVDELHRHLLLVRRHEDEAHVEVVRAASCRPRCRRSSSPSSGCTGQLGDVLVPRVVRREDLQGREDLVGLRGVEHDRPGRSPASSAGRRRPRPARWSAGGGTTIS